MRYEFIEAKKKDRHDTYITLRTLPNWFMRMFGVKSKIVKFYGGGSWWRVLPSCNHAGPSLDRMLSNFREWAKENNQIKGVNATRVY